MQSSKKKAYKNERTRLGSGVQFEINSIDHTPITGREWTDLLKTVYVDDGFTSPELAQRLFEPSAVRKMGSR